MWLCYLGGLFPAIDGSPVTDGDYDRVFGNSWRVISASMMAYLSAQFIDVYLYEFWKKLTKGKCFGCVTTAPQYFLSCLIRL